MAIRATTGLYVGSFAASIFFAAILSATPSTTSAQTAATSVQKQSFDILRDGNPVGTHEVQLETTDDSTRVSVNSRIELSFLGFTVYKLDYSSTEVWDAGGLRRLVVRVDNDGEKSRVDGERKGSAFEWSDGVQNLEHRLPLFPTNHWSVAVLGQDKVLNTLTGEVNAVSIRELGREILRLPGTTVAATRYRYEGQLALDSWYDDRGRWVAMRFQGDDGSTIEYLCSDCQDGTVM